MRNSNSVIYTCLKKMYPKFTEMDDLDIEFSL